jgi:AcrR family transcriptional regulator
MVSKAMTRVAPLNAQDVRAAAKRGERHVGAASGDLFRPGAFRRYHHGDLRRELIQAACALLEGEGVEALSLRSVARRAGVSPAAPYHHFRDRAELVAAVAEAGWVRLGAALAETRLAADIPVLAAMAATYVDFAHRNPALYGVMHLSSREAVASGAAGLAGRGAAREQIRLGLLATEAGEPPISVESLQVAVLAFWSAAHGIAELARRDAASADRPPRVQALLDHRFFGWNASRN